MRARSRARSAGAECASPACRSKTPDVARLAPDPRPTAAIPRHDGIGRREHRADQTVESVDIHRIFKTVRGMQKRVEFLDLPSGQWSGLNRPDWHVPFHPETLSDHAAS